MTVISGGVAFSAVKSIDVDNVHGPGKESEDSESDQKPLGTKMLVQVSMVTTEIRPMSAPELKSAMDFINNSRETIKGLFDKGKDFYDRNEKTFTKIKGAFTVIQGLGSIVSGIKKLQPEEEDPMVKNLADLTTDVKALSDKLTDNFAEMKNLISQQTFFTDIMNPTAVLTMHMMDCLEYPGDDSKRNFRMAYENLSPLTMQYKLNSYLKQDTTNPLRVNMSTEKIKTAEIFEKWEDIYCRVMAQFMLLEAFASGLLGIEEDSDFERLMEASTEVLDDIHKWAVEYGDENWERFRKFLKPWLVQNAHMSNDQKTVAIRNILADYFIRDRFYICAMEDAKLGEQYTYTCANPKHLIVAWNENNFKCLVYRSVTDDKITDKQRNELKNAVSNCTGQLHWTGTLVNLIEDQLIKSKLLPDNGLILLVSHEKHPFFLEGANRATDTVGFHGPGFKQSVSMGIGRNYLMLVAFP